MTPTRRNAARSAWAGGGRTADPAIIIDRVSKTYPARGLFKRLAGRGEAATALDSVSFKVEPGEIVGLLGPNGAGKTTLLKIIAAMLYPSSGRVLVAGRELHRLGARARSQLGLVTSDERSFYWRLTGRQNLRFFATLYGLASRDVERRVEELLDFLNLGAAADRAFSTYSSGMKQKMALARGLLASPPVLLYDEPTRALDPLSARTIRSWIRENVWRSPATAQLIATNQLDEAEQLCDRVIIINHGRVIAEGPIDEVRGQVQDHEQHRIACSPNSLRASPPAAPAEGLLSAHLERKAEEDVLTVRVAKQSDGLNRALRFALDQGASIRSCSHEQVSFDEAFCKLVEQSAAAPKPTEALAS